METALRLLGMIAMPLGMILVLCVIQGSYTFDDWLRRRAEARDEARALQQREAWEAQWAARNQRLSQ